MLGFGIEWQSYRQIILSIKVKKNHLIVTFDISSEMPWSAECNTKNSAFWHKITIDFPMTSKKGPFWHFFQLFSITVDCDGMIDSSNEAYWCNEHKAKILALSWGKILENKKKAKKKFLFEPLLLSAVYCDFFPKQYGIHWISHFVQLTAPIPFKSEKF